TSVRSLATNAQGEVAYTLARGLEMSLRPLRRLQHQHRFALAGNGFSDGTRTLAAHFLVGIKKDGHRTMVSFGLAQCPYSKHHHHDTRFHVQHAWPESTFLLDAERHPGQRSQG